MSNRKALKGAIAAIASVATLGALAAPALADETTTYNLNGKSVAELAQHGGAQRIAAIGNGTAKNVILFIGDGMGDSEITVARDYLKGANGHFEGLDAVGQSAELGDTNAGTGHCTRDTCERSSRTRTCHQARRRADDELLSARFHVAYRDAVAARKLLQGLDHQIPQFLLHLEGSRRTCA